MTEEQKKKCEKIYNLYKLDSRNSGLFTNIKESVKFILMPIIPSSYLVKYGGRWIKITMLLAKVFNKDITKEKADYIVDEIIKNTKIIKLSNKCKVNTSPDSVYYWLLNVYDNREEKTALWEKDSLR